ncbi:hypothetical protein PE066_05005 [Ramlibacter tataouinensis]|uniref:hypothetical protein n=1 Tax=Ramlibacter tataouinensis TaxID=94132 RepID=UPI0022F394C9|nr:hypothetical protein [Ramlibacter tataouinensis]WBY02900.1 hypothetical protein PE066_05005 [Ramlibacter tataouinensis]
MSNRPKRAQAQSSANETAQAALSASFSSASELTREQLAFSAENLAAWFRAAEALQLAQLHLSQRAALLHRQAAENLRNASTPWEMLSVQANLALYDFQEGMRFLQEALVASTRAGGDVSAAAQKREQDEAPQAASAAAQVVEAAINAAAPMAQAWQQVFAASLNGAPTKHH